MTGIKNYLYITHAGKKEFCIMIQKCSNIVPTIEVEEKMLVLFFRHNYTNSNSIIICFPIYASVLSFSNISLKYLKYATALKKKSKKKLVFLLHENHS